MNDLETVFAGICFATWGFALEDSLIDGVVFQLKVERKANG